MNCRVHMHALRQPLALLFHLQKFTELCSRLPSPSQYHELHPKFDQINSKTDDGAIYRLHI